MTSRIDASLWLGDDQPPAVVLLPMPGGERVTLMIDDLGIHGSAATLRATLTAALAALDEATPVTARILPFVRAVHAAPPAVPSGLVPRRGGRGTVAALHPSPASRVVEGGPVRRASVSHDAPAAPALVSSAGAGAQIGPAGGPTCAPEPPAGPPRRTGGGMSDYHPLPDGIHVCPTCGGQKCGRCQMTGRGAYARLYADDVSDGRARIELWFGAPGTAERVALSLNTLAHDRVDGILATLAEAPGVVVRDRRDR